MRPEMNHTASLRNMSIPVIPVNAPGVTASCVLLAALGITIITNVLTIVVMAKSPGLRTLTNTFLVSMSASDELYALFTFGTVAAVIIYFFHRFDYSPIQLQSIVNFAWGTLILSSNGNLILVSLERWLYITQPFLYQRFVSVKSVVACITVTWVSALAVNLPHIFSMLGKKRASYHLTLHGFVYPIIHTFCCLLLVFIYVHISLITLKQVKKISKIQPYRSHPDANNSTRAPPIYRPSFHVENWKAVKLLITICGLFFLFVSPYVYFSSYVLLNPKKARELRSWHNPLLILQSAHHCSNFFVYVLRMRQFKTLLKDDIKKCLCCVGHHDHDSQIDTATSNTEYRDRATSVTDI